MAREVLDDRWPRRRPRRCTSGGEARETPAGRTGLPRPGSEARPPAATSRTGTSPRLRGQRRRGPSETASAPASSRRSVDGPGARRRPARFAPRRSVGLSVQVRSWSPESSRRSRSAPAGPARRSADTTRCAQQIPRSSRSSSSQPSHLGADESRGCSPSSSTATSDGRSGSAHGESIRVCGPGRTRRASTRAGGPPEGRAPPCRSARSNGRMSVMRPNYRHTASDPEEASVTSNAILQPIAMTKLAPHGPDESFDPAACLDRLAERTAQAVRELGRGGAVVAVSGGVDSGVVAGICVRALGPGARAVPASSRAGRGERVLRHRPRAGQLARRARRSRSRSPTRSRRSAATAAATRRFAGSSPSTSPAGDTSWCARSRPGA